jgi:hypothetical protein
MKTLIKSLCGAAFVYVGGIPLFLLGVYLFSQSGKNHRALTHLVKIGKNAKAQGAGADELHTFLSYVHHEDPFV